MTSTPWEGTEPHCYLLSGGEPIGEVDVGWGPARALSSKEVQEFEKVVSEIGKDEFVSRFDKTKFSENSIYPDRWDRENAPTAEEYFKFFEVLKDFLKQASDHNSGAVVWKD